MLSRTFARYSAFELKTKGSGYMKHLDLYARRDPQLAPYILREVDIEYKRKCRKVNFCFWMAMCTLAAFYNNRMSAETIYFMKRYAEYMQAEQECLDDDASIRRRALTQFMNVVRSSYAKTAGKWTSKDAKDADMIFSGFINQPR